VATVDKSGDAQFNGTLLVGGTAQSTGTMTVRNSADAEVDYYLWPGLTTSQKGSFTYKGLERKQPVVHGEKRDQRLGAELGGGGPR